MMKTIMDYPVPTTAPPAPDILNILNQADPPPSLNGLTDLYYPYSEDESILNEMVRNDKINPIKSISSYIRYPLVLENHPLTKYC